MREFSFTITDAARFLGKSPVTLRKWERAGLVEFERVGDDRRFSIAGIRELADTAYSLGRISRGRQDLVQAVCTLMELIEHEDRNSRPARSGQVKAG